MGHIIKVRYKGSFKHAEKLFRNARKDPYRSVLSRYGQLGVNALSAATPVESGKTAVSWGYEIVQSPGNISIVWTNSNVANGYANVAVLLQYGHGTGTGGYVVGRDYINPAIRPIFDRIAKDAWEVIVS